jgi:hypothetical protein
VVDAVAFDERTSNVVLVASRDDLRRSLGSVSLTVLDDASGEPVTAVVEVRPETGDTRSVSTDAKGNAHVDQLLRGDVVVRVFASQRAPVTRKAAIRAGENVDLGMIRMVRTIDILGWADLHSGTLQPPSVFAYRIDPDQPTPSSPSSTASVDGGGAFKFTGVPPGEYLLTTVQGRPPTISAVQEHKLLGWEYVDARSGSVSSVRVP